MLFLKHVLSFSCSFLEKEVIFVQLESTIAAAFVCHVCGIFAPFIYKTIILPRQARDKHWESTQKKMPFFAPKVRQP
jgi:hypothetical protein